MVDQKLKLKVFGIARDIMGGREVEISAVQNVGELRNLLLSTYPKLKERSFLGYSWRESSNVQNQDLVRRSKSYMKSRNALPMKPSS